MLATMAIVVSTHNLAYGVVAGIGISALIFAWKFVDVRGEAHLIEQDSESIRVFRIEGQLYFASAAHIWDHSAMVAVKSVMDKYDT